MYISKSKQCYKTKPSAFYFNVKTKILVDFHILKLTCNLLNLLNLDLLKNFAVFTEKQLKACNFIKKETPTLAFSYKYCAFFKSTYLEEHLRTAASDFFFYLDFLSQPFTNNRTAGEGGAHVFNSSLPLPPASQIVRY